MARFHEKYDLLLTPQMPIPALEAGRVTPPDGSYGDDWIGWSPFTYPFNLTQQPAASVPCGFTSDGLPIGLQIVGPARQRCIWCCAPRARSKARARSPLSTPRDKIDSFQTGVAKPPACARLSLQAGGGVFATSLPSQQQRPLDEWPPEKSLARDAQWQS